MHMHSQMYRLNEFSTYDDHRAYWLGPWLLLGGGGGGGGGGGWTYYTFFLISCFYHSENMYWVTLNVKINFKEFLTPHNPPVHTP